MNQVCLSGLQNSSSDNEMDKNTNSPVRPAVFCFACRYIFLEVSKNLTPDHAEPRVGRCFWAPMVFQGWDKCYISISKPEVSVWTYIFWFHFSQMNKSFWNYFTPRSSFLFLMRVKLYLQKRRNSFRLMRTTRWRHCVTWSPQWEGETGSRVNPWRTDAVHDCQDWDLKPWLHSLTINEK